MSDNTKITKREIGMFGEAEAANFLSRRFYKIVEKNYRKRSCEVDIIAKKGKILCFVEVKTRSGKKYGAPIEAVDYKKQQKIILGAQEYLLQNDWDGEVRFDVIEVYVEKNGKKVRCEKIIHTKNAFEA